MTNESCPGTLIFRSQVRTKTKKMTKLAVFIQNDERRDERLKLMTDLQIIKFKNGYLLMQILICNININLLNLRSFLAAKELQRLKFNLTRSSKWISH